MSHSTSTGHAVVSTRLLVRALCAMLVLCIASTTAFTMADELRPRPQLQKPAQTVLQAHHDTQRIAVKFNDGLHIRLRHGSLTDLGTRALENAQGALDLVRDGQWRRAFDNSEEQLDHWRDVAQRNLNKQVADLNLHFILQLPNEVDAAAAIDAFNALDIVELATPISLPVPLPVPPNFQHAQGYLNVSPGGVDALGSWNVLGTTGAGIRIADVEYSWNLSHQDLPAVTLVGPTPVDPFGSNHHGTAVLGEVGARNNGWGTTGIAYESQLFVAAANTSNGYDVAAGILNALSALSAGDVIIIEQQAFGPNNGNFVPVEWDIINYNAIVTAVGNGVAVVEAAGNGNENLDAALYSTGNGGHWPFLPQNDSGAFIVGAGAAPSGSTVDRSRLTFSTYGSTVDLQGWGEQVMTTGYGDAYSAEGVNLYYTSSFAGTSSASPIVAGAVALLQSRKKQLTGAPFTPAQVRDLLRQTGSLQQSGIHPASQNIGPRPNVMAAVAAAGLSQVNDVCLNSTLVPVGSREFSTVGATTDGPNEPTLCNFGGYTHIENDIWFTHVASCTGTTTVSVCGANFNTKIAVYSGVCPTVSGNALACNDDFCGSASEVSFPTNQGQIRRIRIGGFNGAMGTGTLVISCVPTPQCPADTNNDQQVDVTDLLAIINAWGPCPAPCNADTNTDGQVDVTDLLAVINAWGPC